MQTLTSESTLLLPYITRGAIQVTRFSSCFNPRSSANSSQHHLYWALCFPLDVCSRYYSCCSSLQDFPPLLVHPPSLFSSMVGTMWCLQHSGSPHKTVHGGAPVNYTITVSPGPTEVTTSSTSAPLSAVPYNVINTISIVATNCNLRVFPLLTQDLIAGREW